MPDHTEVESPPPRQFATGLRKGEKHHFPQRRKNLKRVFAPVPLPDGSLKVVRFPGCESGFAKRFRGSLSARPATRPSVPNKEYGDRAYALGGSITADHKRNNHPVLQEGYKRIGNMDLRKSRKELESFTAYCNEHPEQRFWQALRNWSGAVAIWYQGTGDPIELEKSLPNDIVIEDTFHWENFSNKPTP